MRENGPLLSPPGTKGGPRAVNFPGPPKNTFCPGWSHDPGQKGGPFVPGEATTRDQRAFCPWSWLHPGQKAPPYISSPRPLFQHLAFCAVDPPRRRRPELRAAPTECSAPPPRDLRAAAPRPRGAPPRPRDHRRVVAPTTARRTSLPNVPPSSSPSATRSAAPRGSTRCAASSSPTSASPLRRCRA